MNDSKLSIYTATILILAIISQIVSYMAVDRILARTLSQAEQRVYITVSGNETEMTEEGIEIGKNNTAPVDVKISTIEPSKPEYELFYESFHPEGTLTAAAGVNWLGGQKETYYNLPMQGVVSIAQSRGIEGEYWEREDGAKMYGEYVIIAANQTVHPYGSLVETSLGTGIVLDTGEFALWNPEQVDIATTW